MMLAFDEQGSGKDVVLIHGFPLCRRMWRPQVDALSDHGCRVICPDLPGFGESQAADGPVSMATYTDALVSLLDQLSVERAVVGGMSMGGYVLLDLLVRYPERVEGAMFLVTRAAADDEAGRKKRTELADEVLQGDHTIVPETFAKVLFAPETPNQNPGLVAEVQGWMEQTSPRGTVDGLLAMRDRADHIASLPSFALPSLVIGAELDQAVPVQHAETLASGLPQGHLRVLPGAGHMVNLEKPELFNAALLDFLETLTFYPG